MDFDLRLVIADSLHTGGFEVTSRLVGHSVSAADFVVGLAGADAGFVLLFLEALESRGTAPGLEPATATGLAVASSAGRAAAAGVQDGAPQAAVCRERLAGARVARVTAPCHATGRCRAQ